ncbi:MAG: glutathione peroxidase [Phycisphaerales bacterium]|jgi:glutathione peroxidase
MNKLRAVLTTVLPFLSACDSRILDVPTSKETTMNIYANPIRDVHGAQVDANAFDGTVTLVVNLASKCGLTPQYEDLQVLHERFKERGFSVVGFPCNDFGGQEPGNADDILSCASGFGANFPIMEKVSVIEGDSQCAVYSELCKATDAVPQWNFGKYLIDKNGTPVAFFGSRVEPLDEEITARIEELLNTKE